MPNKHFCQGPTCHEQVTQDRFFCGQRCKMEWLELNMDNVEQGRPIEFIRHRRESQGYAKVKSEERWGPEYNIQRVDNEQIVE